jgi:hypothetical protein
MTRNKLRLIQFIICACFVIASYYLFIKKQSRPPEQLSNETLQSPIEKVIPEDRKISYPASVKPDQVKINPPVNVVSKNWKKDLEKSLQLQGGQQVKKISIELVESLIWVQDNTSLNAESVRITLSNQAGEKTSFRAIVDSQTGKILQSFDQPIIDPVNPRAIPGIKVDARYLND